MADDAEPGWVMTWGFFGGRRPRRQPLAPVSMEASAPKKGRPTKGVAEKAVPQRLPAARARRSMPSLLPGLASSIRTFCAPGAKVPPTDSLARDYSRIASTDENPRRREGAMLFAVAEDCIEGDGDQGRAVQAATAALRIFQEVGDEEAEADALRLVVHAQRLKMLALQDAGDEVNLLKTERSATTFLQRVLSTFRAAGKKRSLAAALLAVAQLNFEKRTGAHRDRQADLEEGLACAREAQAMARDAKDQRLEACCLLTLCIYLLRSDAAAAVRAAKASLTLYEAIEDDLMEAKALHALVHACFHSGSSGEALAAVSKAKAAFQGMEDQEMATALVSYSAAQCLLQFRRPSEAAAYAEQALSMLKDLEAEKGWVTAAEALVVEALVTGGEINSGLERAEAALQHADSGAVVDKALALDLAARTQLSQGNKTKALEHAEAALKTCSDMGADRAWEAGALHLVAQVQMSLEDPGKAAVLANGAWRLFGRVGDSTNQAKSMLTEALADIDCGDYYDASETAGEALLLAKDLGDKVLEASALASSAQAGLARDEKDEALQAAKDAVALFQTNVDGRLGEARALRLLASVHVARGDGDQAATPARQALTVARELGDAKAECEVLKLLANLNMMRKGFEEAVRSAQEAFALGKVLGWTPKQEVEAHILVCQTLFGRMCHDTQAAKDGWQIVSRNESKVLLPAEEAVKLARQEEDVALLAFALYTLASVGKYVFISLGNLEKLDSVLSSSREASGLFKKLGDESGEGNVALIMAEVHLACGRFQEAQAMVNAAIQFAQSCGDQELQARAGELFQRGAPQQQAVVPQATQRVVAEVPDTAAGAPSPVNSAAMEEAKPKGLERSYVAELVKKVALEAVGDADDLDMDVALMESGLDSLAAITFRNKLQQETGLKLGGTLMFDYPTMAAVADHMVEISLA